MKTETPMIGLYSRVSTTEQAEKGYSLDEQKSRMQAYCTAMGWTVYKVYTDGGFSGGNTDRPALQQMIADVTSGKLDKVLVWKLDRLSRSQLDTLFLIEKVFLANGVDFVSMQENFDTSTPFGRAMIGILAVFAQLEREQIKERMMVGKTARAKEGKWSGAGVEPIGYDYRDGQLFVNPYEAMQIQEAFDLFISGTSVMGIEKTFLQKGYSHKHGQWSARTLHAVLANPVYIGKINFSGKVYDGQHEPIIDQETFEKAQSRIKAVHRSQITKFDSPYLLSGLVYCASCGARYAPKTDKKRGKYYRYYCCYSKMKTSPKMVRSEHCENKIWRVDDLESIILDEIRKLNLEPGRITSPEAKTRIDPEKPILVELEKVKNQTSRLLDLYALESIDADQLSERIKSLNAQKIRLEDQLAAVQEGSPLRKEDALGIVQTFDEVIRNGDRTQLRNVIALLISRIDIDGNDIIIRWNFS